MGQRYGAALRGGAMGLTGDAGRQQTAQVEVRIAGDPEVLRRFPQQRPLQRQRRPVSPWRTTNTRPRLLSPQLGGFGSPNATTETSKGTISVSPPLGGPPTPNPGCCHLNLVALGPPMSPLRPPRGQPRCRHPLEVLQHPTPAAVTLTQLWVPQCHHSDLQEDNHCAVTLGGPPTPDPGCCHLNLVAFSPPMPPLRPPRGQPLRQQPLEDYQHPTPAVVTLTQLWVPQCHPSDLQGDNHSVVTPWRTTNTRPWLLSP